MKFILIILVLFFGYAFTLLESQPVVKKKIYHRVRNDDYDPLLFIFALPLFAPWLYVFSTKTVGAVMSMGTMGGGGGGGNNGNGPQPGG